LSQNGFDNSGQRVDSPQWTTGNSVDFTLGVLGEISNKYAKAEYQDVVIAIELLNERRFPTSLVVNLRSDNSTVTDSAKSGQLATRLLSCKMASCPQATGMGS
jgi:aryl-phospho-beta-D-glucosidase BglC (GH1 family)